ncbi:MAG: hypothetical protein HZB41_06610 [Ignavibacteriae bacterium]|nr:hypothetical protein [Ignavibacteriota bacterium]
MFKKVRTYLFILLSLILLFLFFNDVFTNGQQDSTLFTKDSAVVILDSISAPKDSISVPTISGITAEDKYPHACVSCHKNYKEMYFDGRISTILKEWSEKGVDEKLLAKIQAGAPDGVNLKGKHSYKSNDNTSIPEDCNKCHGKSMKTALPLSQLVHIIHLNGGKDNHYITMFRGECTHCHKLDMKTGIWSVPNGKENEEEK